AGPHPHRGAGPHPHRGAEPMTRLVLLRHGRTPAAAERRLKGRLDVPLSEAGRAEIEAWRLPEEAAGARWYTSPLGRARETAAILGVAAGVEARLTEMDWGQWEGRSLAELGVDDPDGLAANEARGLDFRPPGGESPRQVQARVRPWLAEVAAGGGVVAAVSHKGVIRAVIGLATDWDFLGEPPVKIDFGCAQVFELAADGRPKVVRLNVPLGAP
ncbi:MAG: histidine phosphatase family protein, partial [Alphaproteobacteria bacterium]